MTVRPVKTQISLGIHPVWSESSLCAQWVAQNPSFLHADSEASDQTGQIPRLIWVFAGRACLFVSFVLRRLILGILVLGTHFTELNKSRYLTKLDYIVFVRYLKMLTHLRKIIVHIIVVHNILPISCTVPKISTSINFLWAHININVQLY